MDNAALLRQLPKVDTLLEHAEVVALADSAPRALIVESLREELEAARSAILAGRADESATGVDTLVAGALARVRDKARPSLRRVINATGIIVHTNLGRSVLSGAAMSAVADAAGGYSTLEYDADSGERGSRHVHVEDLLCRLTGAEAAMAVNNNAAAVMMGLAELARGREAIVSRGQLVEIGGSFRIPDIMRESGATMVEVGTTNKTHLRDYEAAITDKTGLLLKVHSSNYRVVGFTTEVELAELVELGARHGIPVFEDQGSGVLVDLRPFGLPYEPTVGEAVAAGASLVSCSGDKLLGGPQAGILVGRYEIIARLKKHPMARALRLDKMTLAALEATLRLYLDPARALREIPTLRMLTEPVEAVRERATALVSGVSAKAPDSCEIHIVEDVSRAGGGAMPLADIPTVAVAISPARMSEVELERELRLGEPCIVARVNEGRVLLDARTLAADEVGPVADRLAGILGTS